MDRQPEDSMEGKWVPAFSVRSGEGQEVTPDLCCLTVQIVNVVMAGDPDRWALVDAGMPESADAILSAAEKRFGPQNQPEAIILTHGHFDHVGAVVDLAETWDVPVYAHESELPYLTGRARYPEPDPTVEGGMGRQAVPPVPEGSRQPGRPGAEASPGRPGSGHAGLAVDPHAGTHPRTCFPVSGSGPLTDRGRCLCHRPAGFPVQGRHAAKGNQRAAPLLDDGLAVGPGVREAASCLKPLPRHHRPRRPRLRRGIVQGFGAARSGV